MKKAFASTIEGLQPGPKDPKQELRRFQEQTVHLNDPLIGTLLSGRYRVLDKIGQGGMGAVYLAEDERLGKKVAVKVLPLVLREPTIVQRFIQEAKLAPRIDHENVVDVTDLGQTPQGTPFFVMEYLKGTDLGTLLRAEGRLQWGERAKNVMLQICRALGAAHEKGILHRDMKPDNVFLVGREENNDYVKLLDFGIAKLLQSAHDEEKVTKAGAQDVSGQAAGGAGMTMAGTVMGTPQYMSPEQGQGKQLDARADVYSVGILMYHMLAGEVPFDEKEMSDKYPMAVAISIVQKHMSQPVPSLREEHPELNIPEEVENIVMKALHKEPGERFASMREMEIAIAECRVPRISRRMAPLRKEGEGQGAPSRPAMGYAKIRVEDARRKSGRIRRLVAVGLVVAALGAAAATSRLWLSHLHQQKPQIILDYKDKK